MLAGLGILGFAAYKYMSAPTPPPTAGYNPTYIPPGGSAGGYINTTGAPTWVTATGVIMNGLGQILTSIPWDNITSGNATGGQQDWMNYPEY